MTTRSGATPSGSAFLVLNCAAIAATVIAEGDGALDSSDVFSVWGSLSASVTGGEPGNTYLGQMRGSPGTWPLGVQAPNISRPWGALVFQRVAGVHSGTLYASGEDFARAATSSDALPTTPNAYSAPIALPSGNCAISLNPTATAGAAYRVWGTLDPAARSPASAKGGSPLGPLSAGGVINVRGWSHVIVQCIAAGGASALLALDTSISGTPAGVASSVVSSGVAAIVGGTGVTETATTGDVTRTAEAGGIVDTFDGAHTWRVVSDTSVNDALRLDPTADELSIGVGTRTAPPQIDIIERQEPSSTLGASARQRQWYAQDPTAPGLPGAGTSGGGFVFTLSDGKAAAGPGTYVGGMAAPYLIQLGRGGAGTGGGASGAPSSFVIDLLGGAHLVELSGVDGIWRRYVGGAYQQPGPPLARWSVSSSLSSTGSGAAQYPPGQGDGLTSQLAGAIPTSNAVLLDQAAGLTVMEYGFVGNVLNVGQTVTVTCESSTDYGATWTPITGATSAALPCNIATATVATVIFTSATVARGALVRNVWTFSADLTQPVTSMRASLR